MSPWVSGRDQIDGDVTVSVETAGIAHGGVVVCCGDRIVQFAPTDAFEMDSECAPGRPACDIEREGARRDPKASLFLCGGAIDPEVMQTTKVVRRVEMEFGAPELSATVCASTRFCCSQPAPLMRLPTTVSQLSL